jgi:hypothetical protein
MSMITGMAVMFIMSVESMMAFMTVVSMTVLMYVKT